MAHDITTNPCRPLVLRDLRRLVLDSEGLSPLTIVRIVQDTNGTELVATPGSLATGRKFAGNGPDLLRVGDIVTDVRTLNLLPPGSQVEASDGSIFDRIEADTPMWTRLLVEHARSAMAVAEHFPVRVTKVAERLTRKEARQDARAGIIRRDT